MKMKYPILICAFLIAFQMNAQDTASRLSRHTFSVGGGANITIPLAKEVPGGPWGGLPVASVNMFINLSYTYTWHKGKWGLLGLNFGLGTATYSYYGRYGEVALGPPVLIQQITEG